MLYTTLLSCFSAGSYVVHYIVQCQQGLCCRVYPPMSASKTAPHQYSELSQDILEFFIDKAFDKFQQLSPQKN